MKEILFRGKVSELDNSGIRAGDWAIGSLVHQTEFYGDPVDQYHILYSGEFDMDFYDNALVVSETVSQYVGLNDCDGRKIFEGDILESIFKPISKKLGHLIVVTDIRECKFLALSVSQYRIVGNVWDNPELLEGV